MVGNEPRVTRVELFTNAIYLSQKKQYTEAEQLPRSYSGLNGCLDNVKSGALTINLCKIHDAQS